MLLTNWTTKLNKYSWYIITAQICSNLATFYTIFFLITVQRGNDTAVKQAVAKYIAKFRFYTKHLA